MNSRITALSLHCSYTKMRLWLGPRPLGSFQHSLDPYLDLRRRSVAKGKGEKERGEWQGGKKKGKVGRTPRGVPRTARVYPRKMWLGSCYMFLNPTRARNDIIKFAGSAQSNTSSRYYRKQQ